MFDIDRWTEIWASIRSNQLRTLLSGLTIALALFVFITLFGLSKGLQNGFEIEFFPSNVKAVRVYGGRTTMPFKGNKSEREIELKNEDFVFLKENFGEVFNIILPRISKGVTARNFGEYGSYSMVGTTPDQEIVNDSKTIKGRYLDEFDGKKREKNAVIGRLVEKDLFKNQSAVGKEIQLGNSLYKVIGVFSDTDGDDEERMIYVPIETLQIVYGTDKIDGITLLPKDEVSLNEISESAAEIEKQLKIKHGIHPDDTRGIDVFDPKEGLETTDMFFNIFTIIVFVIGIGSLIAGIVSIGNMMVFGVKERTKEIGIRKALGAKPSNIVGLILQEAVVITFLFGAIGIVSAVLLTDFIQDKLKAYLIYDPSVEPSRIVLAAVVLFLSGLLAGFIPARRASRIKPIEALNDE